MMEHPSTRDRYLSWRFLRSVLRIALANVCGIGCLACGEPTWADDVVSVDRGEGEAPAQRRGTIVDYTGEALTLEVAGGRQEKIAADRVVAWQTDRVPALVEADKFRAEGRFADAVVAYQRAVEQEKRTWLRRWILIQLVDCYRNMEQFDRAGDSFLLLLRSDPAATRLASIPLAWKTRQPTPDLARHAAKWLADDKSPTARLLGASWLLSTNQRDEAMEKLQQLATCQDSVIAQLAQAQRWRTEVVTASRADVAGWEEKFRTFAPALQSGPSFVLGQALARHGESRLAALYFLRTPILYRDDRDLAGEALLAAGEQLEKAGDRVGARNAYQELLRDYPQHALAATAEQRLEQLPPK